jgi:hypothetical protein
MSTIKCPKCGLVNHSTISHCRRCKALLALDSKAPQRNRSILHFGVPAIAIVLALGLYIFQNHSPESSATVPERAEKRSTIAAVAPTNQDLEKVKKLGRDFVASLDQNLANRNGEGTKTNQILALNTMKQLKEQFDIITDPAAVRYLNEFSRLVETYYDQVVRYNSETARFDEVRQRNSNNRKHILQDSSLSVEEKAAKQLELWEENAGEEKAAGTLSNNMEETIKSLRNMVSS